MKQDALSVGKDREPSFSIGEIVVVDLTIDKVIGYIYSIEKPFEGWYEICEFFEVFNKTSIFTAREEWITRYEDESR